MTERSLEAGAGPSPPHAKRLGSGAAGLGALLILLFPLPARGYEAAVDATFDAQLYQVKSPFGAPVVGRRRYTETLTLRMHDLQGSHMPGGPELSAFARIRLDSDLGEDGAELSPSREDRFVPGLRESDLDLMTAYIEGRNYGGGLLGFRLGRQYVVDPLGFWSFDGGLVRLTTPAYFAVEAYGGAEQRGGLYLLSSSRFEGDGVYRGTRHGMDPDSWPAYLDESRLAPAYGVSVASDGVDWLDTRITYRKVINRDAVRMEPFPDPGTRAVVSEDRVSQERVGWGAHAVAEDLGALGGELVYDVYVATVSSYAASVDWFAGPTVTLGADLDYFLPTFDGDSIWNWFSRGGTTTAVGRGRWEATRHLAVGASLGARRFEAEAADGASASLVDLLVNTDVRLRPPWGEVTFHGANEHGDRGHRRGVDASLRRFFENGRYEASTLLSLYDWADDLRSERHATSLTYVLGGAIRPFAGTRVGVEGEHSVSALAGHRFRALATLDVTVY